MTEVWQTTALGDICEVFTDGDWVESKDQSPGGIRLIQTGNVGEGVFKDRAEKARYISEETFKRLRCTEIFEGDCLISRLPDPVGRSCLLPDPGERMITAVDCTIVRFDKRRLLPAFFNYYSQSGDYLRTIAKECTGTTRSRISRSNLAMTPVPVPPLAEQQRIVGILDEAFEGIATAKANAEKNLQNARALFESQLQSVFTQRGEGWKHSRLGDIADVQSGGTPLVSEKAYWNGDIPWYSSGELNELLTTEPNRKITTKGLENSNAKVFPCGSLLMGMYDTAALKMSILDRDAAFNQAIAGVKPNRDIDLAFVLFAITAVKPILLLQRRGVRQKNLSLAKIKDISVPTPPLSKQRSTVEQLQYFSDETQRLAIIYERKLAALDDLKKSLLHQAFSGNL
jgi:type I restriction enzyme S subunit